MKFSEAVVRLMLFAVLLFTLIMIIIFCVKDSVPDQLIICYFGFWGVEGGALAWIKNVKTKTVRKKKPPPRDEFDDITK